MWRNLGLARRRPAGSSSVLANALRHHRSFAAAAAGASGSTCHPSPNRSSKSSSSRKQTLVERIVQRHALGLAPGQRVRQGDFISIRPRHVLTHDNSWAVMAKFAGLAPTSSEKGEEAPGPGLAVADPRQPVLALDHNVQDRSARTLARYAGIERFARRQGLDFYPAGRGIGHQVSRDWV